MKNFSIILLSCLLVSCSDKTGMGFEKGSEVSITLFDPLIFPNGKGLDQFEYLYIHKVTSEIVIVKTEKGNRIQIPIEKISSIDDGANRIEFSRKFEEPITEVKAEFEGVNQDELDERGKFPDFIYFIKGSDTLYTGKTYELNRNGQKFIEGNYKDGKRNGLEVMWHENGKKATERNYKDGKEDGLEMGWHENGKKAYEANNKDGKLDGLYLRWHENGQQMAESNYRNGNKIEGSEKFWNSKGEPVKSLKEAFKQ